MEQFGWFNGKEAKIVRSGDMINVYYGGILKPDGPGYGHVKATDGPFDENIVFSGDCLRMKAVRPLWTISSRS